MRSSWATLVFLGLGWPAVATADVSLGVGDEIELGQATWQVVYDLACNEAVCALVQSPGPISGPIRLTLLSVDGALVREPTAIVAEEVSWDVSDPQVAVGDSSILVTWLHGVPGGDELHARTFAFDGNPLGEEITISSGQGNGHGDVEFDGTNYRLVWGWFDGYMSFEVRALRIGSDGNPIEPFVTIARPHQNENEMRPEIACRGGDCLVVWRDYNVDYAYPLLAARLDADGKRKGEPWVLLPEPPGGGDGGSGDGDPHGSESSGCSVSSSSSGGTWSQLWLLLLIVLGRAVPLTGRLALSLRGPYQNGVIP